MITFTAPKSINESIRQPIMAMKKTFTALCMALCMALVPATLLGGCSSGDDDPKGPQIKPEPDQPTALNPGR